MGKNLAHFTMPTFASADFSEVEGGITKKLFALVEGKWKDSKGRDHVFTPERIHRIVKNTNNAIFNGMRIPLLFDHEKRQGKAVGDVIGTFESKVITEDDLPDKRFKHLIGKVGAFCNEALIKSAEAIDQARQGLLSTISPGIDLLTDSFKEVSFTPTPAIPCLTSFSGNNNYIAEFALTFDELEAEGGELDAAKEEYENYTENLWLLLSNVLSADEETLQGTDPMEYIYQALDDFSVRVMNLLGLNEEPEQAQQSPAPPQQPGLPQRQPAPAQYTDTEVLAAFTLDEMERLADFAIPGSGMVKGLGKRAFGGVKGAAKTLGRATGVVRREGLGGISRGIGSTVGAVKGGFKGGVKSGKRFGGIRGAVRQGMSTTGGKLIAGGAAVGATGAVAGGTAYGVNRMRNRQRGM
jgi:hypothetical protein